VRGPTHPRGALDAFVDGRLPPWRRAVVEHHLARCTRCALEVGRTRALQSWLSSAPVPEPSARLTDRLLAIGGVHPHQPEAALPRPRRAVTAVGVLVAGVVLVGAAGVGAAVTVATVPWSGDASRASLSSILPRLWSDEAETTGPADQTRPAGATTARPVDTGARP
jgi:anti-sigma factor RsiW